MSGGRVEARSRVPWRNATWEFLLQGELRAELGVHPLDEEHVRVPPAGQGQRRHPDEAEGAPRR